MSGKKAQIILFAAALVSSLTQSGDVRAGGDTAKPPTVAAEENLNKEVDPLTLKTDLGAFEFRVEIADDPSERAIGLMHRKAMAPNHGMLFAFADTRLVTMWMQNTPLSLDMIFIRPDGSIANIAARTTPFSQAMIFSSEPVSHVLEINAGISALIGLKPGHRVLHRFFPAQ